MHQYGPLIGMLSAMAITFSCYAQSFVTLVCHYYNAVWLYCCFGYCLAPFSNLQCWHNIKTEKVGNRSWFLSQTWSSPASFCPRCNLAPIFAALLNSCYSGPITLWHCRNPTIHYHDSIIVQLPRKCILLSSQESRVVANKLVTEVEDVAILEEVEGIDFED